MQSYSETFGHLFHESAYYVRCGVLSSSLWAAVQALLPLQNWEEEGGGGGVNGVPCRQRAWWRALCNPASLSSRRRPRDVRQPRKLDVRGIPGGSGSICLNILASKPLTPHPIFSCVSHGLRTKPLGFITFLVKDFFDLNKHEISSEHSGLVLTMLDEFALIWIFRSFVRIQKLPTL